MFNDFYTRWDFIGLSSEEKPVPETSEHVVNGSTFYEADTSKLYFWTDGSIVLKSPNGTKYKIAVDNSENITTSPVT